ncbi:alpha/beta hydrolase [Nonomuraea sp. NPDC049152]|uniref:alpha/beta hydrolase n=1 Tax=Nonomuraea sp. NPDC049152 TaxID=3154350 RepID=UPI0033F270F9
MITRVALALALVSSPSTLPAALPAAQAVTEAVAEVVTDDVTGAAAGADSGPFAGAGAGAVPVEERACPVEMPAGTRCGFLVAPERRDGDQAKTVRVGFAVHKASNPAGDPVVYMSGGPASSSIQLTGYLASIFPDRDVVTLEQRGSRYSKPTLGCPETVSAMLDRLRAPRADVARGALDCRRRHEEQGVDLRGYTTKEIAADVVDLRKALGYARWNLFGVSYSTRVTVDAAAADPEGVSAVALDSFLPQDVSWYGDADRNLADTVAALGIGDRFEAMVRRLNARPAQVPTTDPLTGKAFTARLTGDDVATVLAEGLHDASVIAAAPALVDALAEGHDELLRPLADQAGPGLASHEFGLYHAVQCQDEAVFPERSRLFTVTSDKEVCAAWKLPASVPTKATTKAPVLVLGGQYDPTTPVRTARPAAGKLPGARFVEFAGVGHAVFLSTACGARTIAAFFADPAGWKQPCDPSQRGFAPVRPGDLHVTGAPYQVLTSPWLAAPLALFALASLAQLVGGALRGRALTAFAGLAGAAFVGVAADAVWGLMKENETALAVGVPRTLEAYGWIAVGSAVLTVAALLRARTIPNILATVIAAGLLVWWWSWFL